MNIGKTERKTKIDICVEKIPESVMRELAIATLEGAKKFYEDPENVKKYEEWRKNRNNP